MDEWTWRAPELGRPGTLELPDGLLDYYDRGDGPVVVFSHGWLSNANLWRKVVDVLSATCRCVTLDLPLGAHRTPMNQNADLSPEGVGSIIAAAVRNLDLRAVTLVGCDSGGAYSQIGLAGDHNLSSRVSRLVLTACETPSTQWPPPPFDTLPAVAQDVEALGELLGALRDPAVRQSPLAFGLLHKHPLPPRVSDSYALPAISNAAILRDAAKVMSSVSSEPAHRASKELTQRTDLPVLLLWSDEDTVFPLAHADVFAADLHDAHVEVLTDSYSFTPEDRPDELASAIAQFVGTR